MSVPPAAAATPAAAPHPCDPSSSRRKRRRAGDRRAALGAAAGRAARAFLAEELEPRRLFTTIGPNNLFRYRDVDGHFFTIRTGPGVTAELVGATVNPAQTAITLGDLRPVGQGANNDLYAIYVAQSTPDSWITVTADHVLQPQQDPFRGKVADINIFDNLGRRFINGAPVVATADNNTGIGFLGGRIPAIPQPTQDPTAPVPAPFFPQITQNVPQLGVIPGNANIQAGFYVADGNDFGRFIFDGAVAGRVDVGGNMDTFYCGWLLTGNTQGIVGPPYTISVPNNFNVDGDIRNIFSLDSIGTENTVAGDQRYSTGFDLQVGGRLGAVTTRDTFMGKADVHNDADPDNPTRAGNFEPDREIEFIQSGGNNPNPNADLIPTTDAAGAGFSVRNDDFAHPQILGTHLQDLPDGLGRQFVASVDGNFQDLGGFPVGVRDQADYYGVALMAGQKVVIDLDATLQPSGIDAAGILDIALIDPDGRIVASDYVNAGVFGEPFGYTADRPGLYRIAVATNGNVDFAGPSALAAQGLITYSIVVRGPGDLAMGGMSVANNVITTSSAEVDPNPERPSNTTEASIRLRRSDMGAILCGATVRQIGDSVVAVDHGDLRAIEAAQIGNSLTDTASIEVPNGSVGLLHTTGTLAVITGLDDNFAPIPIGVNMQVMSAGGTFFGDLRVDGGIGVIRAADLATAAPSELFVDFDRNGGGFIDMIDCVGDFGSLNGGGPAIDTGVGGNVRYISAGGNVFADAFFFAGTLDPTVYGPSQEVTVVDDGGSRIKLTPVPNQPPTTPTPTPILVPASLSVLAYPVRSGGSVLLDVVSTGSLEVSANGGNSAEVSRIQIRGAGRPVVSASDLIQTPTPTPTPTSRGNLQTDRLVLSPNGLDLTAIIDGNVPVDMLNIVVTNAAGAPGNATAIRNETGGEIVNVIAANVGDLFARGPIGLAKNSSGAAIVRQRTMKLGSALEGGQRPVNFVATADIGNTYPFLGQTTGIAVSGGNVLSISSAMGIGNVMVNGSIGSVTPNVDEQDDGGAFEGINAPVAAFNFNSLPDLNGRGGIATARLAGRLNFVNIGDGILPTGTGAGSRGGLYADRPIGIVQNQGLESDIRGDVVSREAITRVSLNDGAIIGSNIAVFAQFEMSSVLGPAFVIPDTSGPLNNVVYEIGGIDLTGRGGILSSVIEAADIGPVKIDGGFGFLFSELLTTSGTRVEGIQTDGYGIRNALIETSASAGSFSARGDGSSASVLRYTPSVRYAEKAATDPGFLDPFFDVPPSITTDLYLQLGTTPAAPEVAGTTDTGVIEDTVIRGTGQVSSISAFTVRAMLNGIPLLRDASSLLVGVDPPVERDLELMHISYGDTIGSLVTRGPINGLYLSTGRIGTFAPGSDLFNTDVQISGPIGLFKVNGNFAETSNLVASGPNGKIKKLQVLGNLIGNVTSTGKIGNVIVTGLMDGKIESQANGGRAVSIGSVTIGGITPDGQLNVVGNLGKLVVNGDLGTIGSVNNQVQVTGSANSIRINGDLQTNLNVTQNLGTLDVRGSIISSKVTVGDTLKALKVAGDISDDSTVTARILKKQAIKGNVFGQIIITG